MITKEDIIAAGYKIGFTTEVASCRKCTVYELKVANEYNCPVEGCNRIMGLGNYIEKDKSPDTLMKIIEIDKAIKETHR